jgi:signal peptidase
MKKKIGNVVNILSKVWTTIVFIGAIALLGLRFGPVPFGYQPIWCMSNSMAPTFHEGALCYIDTNYDVNTIEVGDIIAYELSNGSMVTHRVHDITENGIITKGDANESEDFAPISRDQIIGKNALQLEQVGNLFKDFPNRLLITIVIFAISAMMMFDVLSDVLLEEDGEKKNEAHKETSQVDSSNSSASNHTCDGIDC